MNVMSILIRVLSVFTFCIFLSSQCIANDSAAERTPSGLKFKVIKDIYIEKEDLKISKNKIEVSYIFRNLSDEEIVTDVAFPLPEYEYVEDNVRGNPWFEDFQVLINGNKVKYEVVARATLNGVDITKKLRNKEITIYDFNATNTEKPERRFSSNKSEYNAFRHAQRASILKMIGKDKEEFIKLDIIGKIGQPHWKVSKSYVWKQKFPPNSTLNITHSYSPCYGSDQHFFDSNKTWTLFIKENCIANENALKIRKNFTKNNWLMRDTVTYILQTANNWKKPIGKFSLHIDTEEADIMGICFDQKINQISPYAYEAEVIDYVPSKDIKVYWMFKQYH